MTDPASPPPPPDAPARAAVPRRRAAFAGVVTVGAALAIGELGAGLVPGIPSPLLAISRLVVDLQPPGAKDVVVGIFGTSDKLALQVLVVVVALAIGAAIGVLARGRPSAATVVIGAFAGAGFLASLRDPDVVPVLAAIVAGVETVAASWVLGWLLAGAAPVAAAGRRGMPDWTRRRLIQRGGAVAVGSVAVAVFGRWLLEKARIPVEAGALPEPAVPATLPAGADIATADLTTAGLTPIVMPNARFYRIDTAFVPPAVDVTTWTLRIHGMVDREVTLTYDQLIALPIIEQFVTIACVSNEVGGDLVGNAAWRGVSLRDVLAMAGVQAGATQLVGRSVDGFTVGMPTAWVMDESRVPMIAVGMNGQVLPRLHGYPARLIVPGLYGYVSATKWLSELELTTLEAFDAYWVPLGWAKEAPILTQSRIDVPQNGTSLAPGRTTIAGVAWAPDRGVERVEVSIDQGPWLPATISAPISDATWVQWVLPWDATSGTHSVEVRATDGTGAVQTADMSRPAPDGARGHHRIAFRVG
ncbi:MAG TPA: molybdopterin-dependent oxidoreductase [Candidatus Acidoferrales bacterium]|nr:molybdopterin-dependent oxidoreductase [Candidatus Acidoferrales bacterium]